VFDDYTADLEELEKKRKEQKKRQVVIKSIEEVAEDRIEANKPDEDEDPIIRNMAEEEDKTPADIEAELNQRFADAGINRTEATELSELGIRPEDLANIDVIGQTTLVTGRKADVFKSIDEATLSK
jgi:hypothetical protein